jgi:predicted Ser/Thr protein kinase
MSHPQKHIIIDKSPVLIDFERARYTETPKNITQFCDYITSKKFIQLLEQKNIHLNRETIIDTAKEYRKNKKVYKKIISSISSTASA